IIEPRPFLGGGLAYSSKEPSHRVNVPASRMSLSPDEPEHFSRWLAHDGEAERDPDAVWRNGDIFPRRQVFGRYVAEQLAPHIASGAIRHVRECAGDVKRNGDGWIVTASGQPIAADMVVLAMTHPSPDVPVALEPIADTGGFVADVYSGDALGSIAPEASVLIVGSGLTSADTVA
ncbi:MAG: hydroxyacylglutathione hydrolase, partial [Mesorhizobium sp.]